MLLQLMQPKVSIARKNFCAGAMKKHILAKLLIISSPQEILSGPYTASDIDELRNNCHLNTNIEQFTTMWKFMIYESFYPTNYLVLMVNGPFQNISPSLFICLPTQSLNYTVK